MSSKMVGGFATPPSSSSPCDGEVMSEDHLKLQTDCKAAEKTFPSWGFLLNMQFFISFSIDFFVFCFDWYPERPVYFTFYLFFLEEGKHSTCAGKDLKDIVAVQLCQGKYPY